MPFLQSLTSFFSTQSSNNASSSRQSRRTAVDNTFDAFSLPTSRYNDGHGLGIDGLNSASSSPGPSRRASNAFAYPPPTGTYQPSSNIHPPLSHTFHRLRNALADSFPELLETLNRPVDSATLASFERELGCPLPPSVRESFMIADGQDIDSGCSGLFFGLHLLPLEDVMREWAFWRQAEHDPDAGQNPAVLATMASVPPTWIKQLYACRGWLPLLTDRTGNYVGVDLDPGPGGAWGQVIVFGRDFDRKCVLWRGDGEAGWGKWLASFVDELESGDGWEADKSSSSDEEDEVGYGSYNGGALAGEVGKGLRLAGEYRGWNVLEAWWDRSVRQWEQLGMGLDVEEVERGLSEARRLAGMLDEAQAPPKLQEEVPVYGSPQIPPAPSTPVPADSDALLPPSSPDHPTSQRLKQKIPVRIITPIAASDHPLAPPETTERDLSAGYLSPPDGRRTKAPPPAPTPLDLPTRVDIQAMSAIAQAEASGLRGGWVMNMDPGINARMRQDDMVDIDLEGGRGDKFGSPRPSDEQMERLREVEKMSLAGRYRTPSPMLRSSSLEIPGQSGSVTPVRTQSHQGFSAQGLRRPPPIASPSDVSTRRFGGPDDERDAPVLRAGSRALSRTERESSVFSEMSETSQDGLLNTVPSRTASPALSEHVTSPITVTGGSARSSLDRSRTVRRETSDRGNNKAKDQENGLSGLEGDMEEVSLEGGMSGFREIPV